MITNYYQQEVPDYIDLEQMEQELEAACAIDPIILAYQKREAEWLQVEGDRIKELNAAIDAARARQNELRLQMSKLKMEMHNNDQQIKAMMRRGYLRQSTLTTLHRKMKKRRLALSVQISQNHAREREEEFKLRFISHLQRIKPNKSQNTDETQTQPQDGDLLRPVQDLGGDQAGVHQVPEQGSSPASG